MFTSTKLTDSVAIRAVFEEDFPAWRDAQPPNVHTWLSASQFRPDRLKLALVPAQDGALQSVLLGLGRQQTTEDPWFWAAASLPERLPGGRFHLEEVPAVALQKFALGWAYGHYRFDRYRKVPSDKVQTLSVDAPVDVAEVQRLGAASSLARDLVNTPANDMSPAHLMEAALAVAKKYGAIARIYIGNELLANNFPTVHAVGRAGAVEPRLLDMQWGNPGHPKVTLVGKGVCFDTGGLDLKPSASMLMMKKDMGGAATALGLAQAIMDAGLAIRLRLIIPAVENSVAGNAFRPGDVLQTRKGLSVEIGNTDAEGRLILSDALSLADEAQPELLIDFATLTGAARVALGPELPALFASNDELARALIAHGTQASDPLWQLPFWAGYDDEFSSKIADMNNVSSSGLAGAIIGALFLRRFVSRATAWAHIDMYAWNGKERPGRPVGAEPQCIRAVYGYLKARYGQ
jgi:leucyl aminopeptidase